MTSVAQCLDSVECEMHASLVTMTDDELAYTVYFQRDRLLEAIEKAKERLEKAPSAPSNA